MVPVVPALVVFAAQARTPRYFTNAENVRRIAAGKRFVAFATSGGVRVFERTTQKWRVYTQNDGLPTHNIHDVVFDKAKPDTLWILCGAWGDWANEQPEPDLRIITLDLASGKVEPVAPSIPAPRTARMGYQYFLDYRLSISESWAFIFTDKGMALAWDRNTKNWTRQVSVEPTPARPSFYPGWRATVAKTAETASFLAFYTGPITAISMSTPGWEGTKNGLPTIWLYDKETQKLTAHLLPKAGKKVRSETQPDGSEIYTENIGPLNFLKDTESNSILVEVLEIEYQDIHKEDSRARRIGAFTVVYRVAPYLASPIEISRRRRTPEMPPLTYESASLPYLQGFFMTDFLLEENTLWIAGYNDPDRERSSGIAQLDLTMRKWVGPKPAESGLSANFLRLNPTPSGLEARSSFFMPSRFYDPATGNFDKPKPKLSYDAPLANSTIPDPRIPVEEQGYTQRWYGLNVLGYEGSTALVLATAKPTPRNLWVNEERRPQTPSYDTLYFYDVPTKKLTKLVAPSLTGLQFKAAGFTPEGFFFLTEERTPTEKRGNPVVLRWNRKTGAIKRYPESLFRSVSVAAQRTAGTQQQTDLKQRQKERNKRLLENPQDLEEPVTIKPVGAFLPTLRGLFVNAAGTTWLRLDQHLFRYDARRDTWFAEGLADSLSPEGETALWKQVGPEWWRFGSSEGRRLRGEVARWSAGTGWKKLELGADARQASNRVVFHDGALWLTGVGVLLLPPSAWVFQK
ncbi:hypothetical protein [Armatimonas sp.]|uniref:hypothetical protein n=1 Tax=Armatimonas sp. TaxID=1872638 RepID=UPI00286C6E35|nr:hypothetical protein [Armatimonas sp.]